MSRRITVSRPGHVRRLRDAGRTKSRLWLPRVRGLVSAGSALYGLVLGVCPPTGPNRHCDNKVGYRVRVAEIPLDASTAEAGGLLLSARPASLEVE